MDTCIVVVAAGSSSRFHGDKLGAELRGRSVLERALEAVREPFPQAPVVVVLRPEAVAAQGPAWELLGIRVAAGGERRQDSVKRGFAALDPADDAVVLVHDGARPFVPPGDVKAVADAAREFGAAVLVAPLVDTIKRVGPDGRVVSTLPRDELVRALTPQAFRASLLRRAWEGTQRGTWTDEASLVEAHGFAVQAVPGDSRNLKVTRQEDLLMLSGLFPVMTRVGQGIDVHPFAAGRPLWLCGIKIPSEIGLAGHSDADVALHAVTDAILGACCGGDIGQHFPPSDELWRNADSAQFVVFAVRFAGSRGFQVSHCDLTILAEVPRIAPHREAMRARLAGVLGLGIHSVNIKATTCEGLGFVGRAEGIMATAVVTVEHA